MNQLPCFQMMLLIRMCPLLLSHEDDVEGSCGKFGKIDEAVRFYIMSRGLSKGSGGLILMAKFGEKLSL